MGILQSFLDIFHRYAKMAAYCNSCQGIVNTELSWKIDLYREIHQSLYIIGNAQGSFSCDKPCIFRPQICFFRKTKGFRLAGMSLQDPFQMGIISIKNSHFALSEQHALAVKIIIKILVLVGADMIRLNICKDTNIKSKA